MPKQLETRLKTNVIDMLWQIVKYNALDDGNVMNLNGAFKILWNTATIENNFMPISQFFQDITTKSEFTHSEFGETTAISNTLKLDILIILIKELSEDDLTKKVPNPATRKNGTIALYQLILELNNNSNQIQTALKERFPSPHDTPEALSPREPESETDLGKQFNPPNHFSF